MESENVIETSEAINWPLCIALAKNNSDLAKEILKRFITELPNASRNIHDAYIAQRYSDLVDHIHALHGASSYCGVKKLEQILSQMEFFAKQRSYDKLETLWQLFTVEVERVNSLYQNLEIAKFI